MRVFVTGATGFVGSAVVRELIAAGHTVLGLARSDVGALALEQAGAEVRQGVIEDLDLLARSAAECEGVIHTAFNHDFTRFQQNCEDDERAIHALGGALAGSDKPLLVTSGTARLAPGRVATEDDRPQEGAGYPRVSEKAAMAMADKGVRAGVIRLAPTTHGAGDHGFVPNLINTAREKGGSAYIGDGMNLWSAVHRADAARLYRLALEKGASGARYHAVAEQGIAFKDIAAAIGKGLGVPVKSVADDEAAAHFGWFVGFASMDAATSSERTRKELGWTPTGPDLLTDMFEGGYFAAS